MPQSMTSKKFKIPYQITEGLVHAMLRDFRRLLKCNINRESPNRYLIYFSASTI